MEDEIKQLRTKLEVLERQKKEEEERNKDPFRHLRERIDDRTRLVYLEHQKRNPCQLTIRSLTRDLECDKCILEAIVSLQAEVKVLRGVKVLHGVRATPRNRRNSIDITL